MDWRQYAACRSFPPEDVDRLFFGNSTLGLAEGRLVCQECPVRPQCGLQADRFEVGTEGNSRHAAGTWGGESVRERIERRKASDGPRPVGVGAARRQAVSA